MDDGAFDNSDIELGVIDNSWLAFEVPADATVTDLAVLYAG